jgi:hypothetical protein
MQSTLIWVIIGITDIIIMIAVVIHNMAINDTLIPDAPITDIMTIYILFTSDEPAV